MQHQLHRFLFRLNLPVELCLFNGLQDRLEGRSGGKTQSFQVLAAQEPGRPHLLGRSFGQESQHEIIGLQAAVA
jgi:hypothetical protein